MSEVACAPQNFNYNVDFFCFFDSGTLPIYNCCTSNQRSVTLEQIIDMGKEIQHEAPMEKVLWLPGGGLTRWRLINYIRVILLHILPAFIIDAGLKLKGEKPL